MLRSPNCAPQLQPPRSTPSADARFSNSRRRACRARLRHPEVVGLHEHARLGDVGLVDREPAVVEDVAERRVHAALRRAADAAVAPDLDEPLAALIDVELGDAVVVGEEQVREARAREIRRGRGQRPAPRLNAQRRRRLLERAVAAIVEHVLPAAVLGVLEALRHDARGLQVPEVDVLRPVAREEQVEPAVAVVVPPDRRVGVDPGRQPRLLGHAHERSSAVVAEELRPAVLVEEEIFVAVVVEVPPHRAHRHARAGSIDIGESDGRGDVGERAVAVVAIQPVQAALAAVRDVEVLPAVAVEVGDGHRRAHRGDLRHDVLELRVERRALMDEVMPSAGRIPPAEIRACRAVASGPAVAPPAPSTG